MGGADVQEGELLLPFSASDWPVALRPAAEALWQWHLHLAHLEVDVDNQEARFFDEEEERAKAAHPLRILPPDVCTAAYETCRIYNLSLITLAQQVRAASWFTAPIRFQTRSEVDVFMEQWAFSHAQLLGGLVELTGSWQRPLVEETARAFFLLGYILNLPQDLVKDRIYIPLDELAQAGVTVEQLQAGEVNEAVRRLLWKQTVRIRDAFAQAQGLVHELPRRQARVFKKWWLGGLEVVHEIERRKYDLWTNPIRLTALQRFRVRLQALVGRTSFRR